MHRNPGAEQGFSLVELMVAMTLGLIVVAAAISILIANRSTYAANQGLSRVQENARASFELMARDLRNAGGNACNSRAGMAVINTLNEADANWWSNWGATGAGVIQGYGNDQALPGVAFGTGAAERVEDTDALTVLSGSDRSVNVTAHDPAAATFTVRSADHGFANGTILLACGPNAEPTGVIRLGSIFQMTSGEEGTTLGNATGGGSPGNATSSLGFSGAPFQFAPNTLVSELRATRWYVGNNGRGGRSLYQGVLVANGVVQNQEVADGVQDLQVTYLVPSAGGYIEAEAVGARWPEVTAVSLNLVQSSVDRVGTDRQALQRTLASTVTLRSRNP